MLPIRLSPRKKKTQKTKETQYVETDEHPFQSKKNQSQWSSF